MMELLFVLAFYSVTALIFEYVMSGGFIKLTEQQMMDILDDVECLIGRRHLYRGTKSDICGCIYWRGCFCFLDGGKPSMIPIKYNKMIKEKIKELTPAYLERQRSKIL